MFSTQMVKTALASAAMAAVLVAGVDTAFARCTRLAFSVNDYGKDGPTKDAQALLDKYVAKWAAERGIKTYTTGKKETSCELFLDFGVFDEHTCKAAATVCWPGDALPAPLPVGAPGVDGKPVKSSAPRTAVKPGAAASTKTAAPGQATSPITTGALPAPSTLPAPAAIPSAPAPAAVTPSVPVAAPAYPSGPPTPPEPVAPAVKAPAKTE